MSGKGGTGKTTVCAALAQLMKPVVLADCDVEGPNLHLLLAPRIDKAFNIKVSRKARIDARLCDGCGACVEGCRFGAISPYRPYHVDPFLCEGCGVCEFKCPRGAVKLSEREGARVYTGMTSYGPMAGAELAVGEEASGKVVTRVRMEAQLLASDGGLPLVIIDGSPGTGCPVIASMSGADLVLAVTEPSVSGMHDLDRILGVAEHFGIPSVVCINKCDLVPELTRSIREACRSKGIEVVAEIPYCEQVVDALRRGRPPLGNVTAEVEKPLADLADAISDP